MSARRLFASSELEPVDYRPADKTRKIQDRRYEEIISNYAEVRASSTGMASDMSSEPPTLLEY